MKLNKYWFKPKRFGYGAYPSTIEGWVFTLIYFVFFYMIGYYSINVDNNFYVFIVYLIILSIIFLYISKKKTKEKWKFRWGKYNN